MPRPVVHVAGCLAITVPGTMLATATLRRLWPEVETSIAVGVSVVLFAGLLLWGYNRHEVGAKSNLGAALLAGTLAAVAVFAVQADLDAGRQAAALHAARERDAAADRQWLQLTLGINRDLTGIDLQHMDLTEFYMRGKNLTEAKLSGANLNRVDLSEARMEAIGLEDASLRRADLTESNLIGAFLMGADLSGATLTESNLTNAFLTGADLSGATLANADLSGADLSNADLSGADLLGARLDRATATRGTRWPVGFDWRAAGVTLQ